MTVHRPVTRTQQIQLPSGGRIELTRLYEPAEADALQGRLARELKWEQREIVLFGKRILQPRLVYWCGQKPYRYSGQTLPPRPCPSLVTELLRRVSEEARVSFNHVLGNRYRDGRDSMGYHADDEPELGEAPTVASLSFGAPRPFVLKSRQSRREAPTRIVLEPGMLLVMRPPCQSAYRHALPRLAALGAERISLTFRCVVAEPGGRGGAPPG